MNYLSSLYITNDKLSFYKKMTLTVKTNLVAAGGSKNKNDTVVTRLLVTVAMLRVASLTINDAIKQIIHFLYFKIYLYL